MEEITVDMVASAIADLKGNRWDTCAGNIGEELGFGTSRVDDIKVHELLIAAMKERRIYYAGDGKYELLNSR